jgi:hypothetical protein
MHHQWKQARRIFEQLCQFSDAHTSRRHDYVLKGTMSQDASVYWVRRFCGLVQNGLDADACTSQRARTTSAAGTVRTRAARELPAQNHIPNKETGIVRRTVTFDAGYLFITELQLGHCGLTAKRMCLKRSEQQKVSCPALLLPLLHDRSSTTKSNTRKDSPCQVASRFSQRLACAGARLINLIKETLPCSL